MYEALSCYIHTCHQELSLRVAWEEAILIKQIVHHAGEDFLLPLHLARLEPAHVSIRQHPSAYVSILLLNESDPQELACSSVSHALVD